MTRRLLCRWLKWHVYGDSYDVAGLRVAECRYCGWRLMHILPPEEDE